MSDQDTLVTTDQFNAGLADVRGELRTEIAAVRVELVNLDKRLTGEIAELRTELRTGFADVRAEIAGVHAEIAGVHAAIAKLGEQQARTETHRLRWTLGAIVAGVSARRCDPAPAGRLTPSGTQPDAGNRPRLSERTASTSS